jgi:hypothetical protein
MAFDHGCQSGRHALVERGHDLYSTPSVAVEALLKVETLPHHVWEPATGRGSIVRALRDGGHAVIASDIIHYDFTLDFESDFLAQVGAPSGIELILTNPPYRDATRFVDHALTLCPRVIMLCRLAFLESECRSNILDTGTLSAVHVFKRRLPMMHRDGWTGPRASSAMPFAWFVWNRNHDGPAIVDRITWENRSEAPR